MLGVPVASGALFCLSKASFSAPATGTHGKGRGASEPDRGLAAGRLLSSRPVWQVCPLRTASDSFPFSAFKNIMEIEEVSALIRRVCVGVSVIDVEESNPSLYSLDTSFFINLAKFLSNYLFYSSFMLGSLIKNIPHGTSHTGQNDTGNDYVSLSASTSSLGRYTVLFSLISLLDWYSL